eukprot:2633858-Pyramimonas_sp.AAC.3
MSSRWAQVGLSVEAGMGIRTCTNIIEAMGPARRRCASSTSCVRRSRLALASSPGTAPSRMHTTSNPVRMMD